MKSLLFGFSFLWVSSVYGQSVSNVAFLRAICFLRGHTYTSIVDQHDFDQRSTWPIGAENPSASTRQVLAAADRVIKMLFKHSKDFHFGHLALHPGCAGVGYRTQKWYYEAVYEVYPGEDADGPQDQFTVIVLLDGTAVIPTIGKETR